MKKILIYPEVPGVLAGVVVFLYTLYLAIPMLAAELVTEHSFFEKAPAVLMMPVTLIAAAALGLAAWELMARIVARLEFTAEEYTRFCEMRAWRRSK
jgi:hypothetical protein